MILFQTDKFQHDLTNRGITFNEKSDYFSDSISKNFSFPFYVYLHEELAEKLGLVNIENVRSYQSKVYGYLIKDREFFDAYISINSVKGNRAELTLFYGEEVLPVFDKNLKQLPFPIITATGGLPAFAKNQISKEWPAATHNFVKMFRPNLQNEENYTYFEKFVNNYVDNNGTWEFPENTIDVIEGEQIPVNRNVMVPMPYLLEIFKVIFASEGKEVRGDFMNDEFNKKIVYIPKHFFEHYYVSQFENYSFSIRTSQETIAGKTVNVYKRIHTPTSVGSFTLKMKLTMSDLVAKYFKLTVVQNDVILYEAFSENNVVAVNETLDINIVNTSVFDPIVVELRLLAQDTSIAAYNSFTYEFKEGQLNVFPEVYTLADFMPDMNVRDFVNKIKTWFNLKFDYTKNAVYINYLENLTDTLVFDDKRHLQEPEPERIINNNNLFKLKYLDGQEVLVNKNGQTYSDLDYVAAETEEINIDVLPLLVNSNLNTVTAVYPKDEEDLMFTLYNGPVNGEPLATNQINNRKLSLDHVFLNNWKNWLRFRANSETYKDSFFMQVTEFLSFKKPIFKYNKKHIIKSIQKKRVNKDYWKVDVETETL